jgi:subtilisin family serine protease
MKRMQGCVSSTSLHFFEARNKPMLNPRHAPRLLTALMLLALTGSAQAQVGLPGGLRPNVGAGVGGSVSGALDRLDNTLGEVTRPATQLVSDARQLADARLERLGDFLRSHRTTVEADDTGQPARAHEVLLLSPDAAALASAQAAGYALVEQGDLDGLGIAYARLATPTGTSLTAALRQLRHLLPGKEISADQLHFPGGSTHAGGNEPQPSAAMPHGGGWHHRWRHAAGAAHRGSGRFCSGRPRPNAHAQAIASLLAGAGTARIYVADVYGSDPAGGNALAIARALAWMAGRTVPVVSISLVGPSNPLLSRAVAAVQAKGMIVTAAVGNDGAAAPPAFPASYDGVVAVTGVDGQGRVLFEAGRASHLDYAAPGADMTAIGLSGKAEKLRGTSFAALWWRRASRRWGRGGAPRAILQRADAEAVKARNTGHGVLCGTCRKGL